MRRTQANASVARLAVGAQDPDLCKMDDSVCLVVNARTQTDVNMDGEHTDPSKTVIAEYRILDT